MPEDSFNSILEFYIFTPLQRMQTSAKGTYTGMLQCAGGILKNEGPLAFYKVGSVLNEIKDIGI